MFLINLIITVLITSCATIPLTNEEVHRPPLSQDDEYPIAEKLDQILNHNQPATKLLSEEISHCKKDSQFSVFCPTIKKIKSIILFTNQETPTYSPSEPKTVIPVVPEIKGGKIQQIKKIKTSDIAPLLKGIETLSKENIEALSNIIVKDTKCPDNLSVALAANLEDYLPDARYEAIIPLLYLKGAKCTKNNPIDKENFQTRAALFYILNKKYSQAETILSKVKPLHAYSGRATYWLYQTRLELKKIDKAAIAYKTLLQVLPFSFHTLITLKNEGKDLLNLLLAKNTEPANTKSKSANSIIQQFEKLSLYGHKQTTEKLSFYYLKSTKKIDQTTFLNLLNYASPRTKILLAQEKLQYKKSWANSEMFQYAYPKPYFDIFQANQRNLNPYLFLAIARKESALDPKAISHANAQGIMQLNPLTAEKVDGSSENLLDPARNIKIGTRYFSELTDEFNQEIYWAIAAYNAGDVPVKKWLTRFPKANTLLKLDLIPYRETRDYVGYVLANYYWYLRLNADEKVLQKSLSDL